jgi:uncharacterized protein DUF5658
MKKSAGVLALVSLIGLGSAQGALAQSPTLPGEIGAFRIAEVNAAGAPALFAKMILPASTDPWLLNGGAAARGPALPGLYGSLISLQVYDGYSTSRGLQQGAAESNGLMASLATHPAQLWALKGATALTSIYMAEQLWRQHRRGAAIALMVASNAIMAGVAANNAAVLRRLK